MSNSDPKRFRIAVQLDSSSETLAIAERLEQLAQRRPDLRDELLAAAVVAAATALAQGVDVRLSGLAAQEWAEGGVDSPDPRESSIAEMMNLSLRQRVVRLPQILSHNRVRFKEGHEVTQALCRLIDRRNRLVHVTDEPHVVRGDHESVRLANGHRLEVSVPIPSHPWHSVVRR